jgi:hypothetical protein
MTIPAFPYGVAAPAAAGPAPADLRNLARAVRLIDRRTGQTHRINGRPLVLFTRNPAQAVADLLEGRDAAVWEARIEPIEARLS